MRLILIGFAASYKTTVGRLLSEKFLTQFVDTDLQVEKALGKSVAEIINTCGEAVFRHAENEVLAGLQKQNGVISCGGGAVLSPLFGEFSQGSIVVWLQSSAQTVRERFQRGVRPLFDYLSLQELQEQMEQRAPLYRKYATFSLSTDGKTSSEVAEEVAKKLSY